MRWMPPGEAMISINFQNDTNHSDFNQISLYTWDSRGINFGREQRVYEDNELNTMSSGYVMDC